LLVISAILENKLMEKRADSDGSELSDTDESSESDVHDEEDVVSLPNSEDDGDESVYVTNTDFLWEHLNNYSELREVSTRMFGPQYSAQGVTDIVDVQGAAEYSRQFKFVKWVIYFQLM
jgi:hypothetical protein